MDQILSSWKEIASFLGRGVRTVQRWELHLGLPIHRPDNSPQSIVFARKSELLRWFESRGAAANSANKLRKILLADEDYETINRIRFALENDGYLVFGCQDENRAEMILRYGPGVDLLLFGPAFSDIKKKTLMARLKEIAPEVPVVTHMELNMGDEGNFSEVIESVDSYRPDDWLFHAYEVARSCVAVQTTH